MPSNIRDLYNHVTPVRGISPLNISGDTPAVSEIVDMQGFTSCLFGISYGSLADAGATFTVLVEEDDAALMGTATAVADADLNGTEAAASVTQANDNVVRIIEYKGRKRYVRLTITPSGNAGDAYASVIALKHGGNVEPAAIS